MVEKLDMAVALLAVPGGGGGGGGGWNNDTMCVMHATFCELLGWSEYKRGPFRNPAGAGGWHEVRIGVFPIELSWNGK